MTPAKLADVVEHSRRWLAVAAARDMPIAGATHEAMVQLADERDAMTAENARLRDVNARLVALLSGMEWVEEEIEPGWACPKCFQWKRDGHAAGCELAALLSEIKAGA